MRVHLLHAAPQAAEGGSNRLGLQVLFAFGVLLLVVALFGAMRRAWVRRAEQQEEELHDLPEPPADPGTVLAAPLRGMYLGTVDAGHWLEWISARGLGGKAGAYVTVYASGVQVDRAGTAFWIPREAVRGARLERAHAGKVASPGRLVVIAWSFDGHELETGFRGEDRARQPKVVRAVHDLIGPAPAVPAEGEITNPRGMQRGRLRLRTRAEGTRADAGAQPPADRGARLPTPRLARPPRPRADRPGAARSPGAAAYPGARPYADPGRQADPGREADPGRQADPGRRSGAEPVPAADANNSPATTPIPLVVRARPTGSVPVPVPEHTGRPAAAPQHPAAPRQPYPSYQQPPSYQEQPYQERSHQEPSYQEQRPYQQPYQEQQSHQPQPYQQPQAPHRPNPAHPPPVAGAVPQDPEAAYIDPLTSPLGQVVRRMHDDR